MQPHPIPQNVTSFQFRLVGDMTLKQFMYLAAGSGIAYILFVFFAAEAPILIWPLIATSALLGVSFAFLPISSRPLDFWVGAFLKAIYSPTKRVWKKNGKLYRDEPTFNSRFVAYLSKLQPPPLPSTGELSSQPTQMPASPGEPLYQPTPTPALPTQEELKKTVDLARQAQALQMRIVQTERQLHQIKSAAQVPTQISADYTQQVNKVLSDLQNLVSQASFIKQQIASVSPSPQIPPQPVTVKPKVKVVIPAKPKPTQVALTSFPNVINGIIRSAKGDYLEGVVVVIYDKEGLPVRALKSNKLGQFSGSTPLPNGTYTVELEKEGFTFDVLQLELVSAVLPPLTITAKGGNP